MKTHASQFAELMKLDLRTNGKKYLMWIGIIFGCLAAITFFFVSVNYNMYGYNFSNNTIDPMEHNQQFIFWFTMVPLCCISASLIFSQLGTKGGAIANLMLPATQLQKYAWRWVLMVPAFFVVYFICFELVDLLRYFYLSIFLDDTTRLHLFTYNFFGSDPQAVEYIFTIGMVLALQSFFVLGSAIWPKHGLWLTCLSLVVINIAMGIFIAIYVSWFESWFEPGERRSLDGDVLQWVVCGLFYLTVVVNTVLAYFRYKEIELVPRW